MFHHDGQDWIWLHPAAQRFVAQAVRVAANDGQTVWIAGGLHGGERVVSRGVETLNALLQAGEEP